jgi:hypothetical protein
MPRRKNWRLLLKHYPARAAICGFPATLDAAFEWGAVDASRVVAVFDHVPALSKAIAPF